MQRVAGYTRGDDQRENANLAPAGTGVRCGVNLNRATAGGQQDSAIMLANIAKVVTKSNRQAVTCKRA